MVGKAKGGHFPPNPPLANPNHGLHHYFFGGGPNCPPGRAKGVALVPLPPLATPGWATGNGGHRVWLGVALGVFSLNSV